MHAAKTDSLLIFIRTMRDEAKTKKIISSKVEKIVGAIYYIHARLTRLLISISVFSPSSFHTLDQTSLFPTYIYQEKSSSVEEKKIINILEDN